MTDPITHDFQAFGKIARLTRPCVITEKIDGTNAQVLIGEDGSVRAGSRNRWIAPGKETDNHGFAQWVADHADELRRLGPGRHYGEWWGAGIQRSYGLREKRFSLFNTGRWIGFEMAGVEVHEGERLAPPACCHVVPVLFRGDFSTDYAGALIDILRERGSVAAPGFTRPEGIVVYHVAAGVYFKKTIDRDTERKGKQP